MPLYLDGKPFAVKKQTDAGQLLELVNEKLSTQGRVLQQVLVNGQSVEEDWLQALGNARQGDVSFISLPASQVLQDALTNMVEILHQLALDIREVAHFLQTGEDEKAFPLIATSVNGLQSYIQILPLISQYLPAQAHTTQQHLEPLMEWLQKFMVVWQGDDFVLMADYLLYEIEPLLQGGYDWLKTLIA